MYKLDNEDSYTEIQDEKDTKDQIIEDSRNKSKLYHYFR